MNDGQDVTDKTKRKLPFRKRTAFGLVAFVLLSAAFHFTLGPELTKLTPRWAGPDMPDQVSIITLSRKQELQKLVPAPTPTPSPQPLPRTNRDLAALKYKEMAKLTDVHMSVVHPPARRKATIMIDRPAKPQNDVREANVVAAAAQPTPRASQPPGPDKTSTGSTVDLSGNVVWGDDNPVRVIKQAPLGVADSATGTASVQVDVGPDGQVLDVQLLKSSGDPNVDAAALAAARASTFAPATLNGLPIHGQCELDFPPPASQTT
jgi:TonB family protein